MGESSCEYLVGVVNSRLDAQVEKLNKVEKAVEELERLLNKFDGVDMEAITRISLDKDNNNLIHIDGNLGIRKGIFFDSGKLQGSDSDGDIQRFLMHTEDGTIFRFWSSGEGEDRWVSVEDGVDRGTGSDKSGSYDAEGKHWDF